MNRSSGGIGGTTKLLIVVTFSLVAAACSVGDLSFGGSDGEAEQPASTEILQSEAADGGGLSDGQSSVDSQPDEVVPDQQGGSLVVSAEFEPGDCPFEIPSEWDPDCGIVTVPMNWETGDGEVRLPVAVFASTAANPAADPVIYLEGGPGGHALETIEFVLDDQVAPLQARSDVIFFDQRGAGYSEPRLNCSETKEISRAQEDDPTIDDDVAFQQFLDALAACKERLIGEGIDLSTFNSISNAHDVEAIRVALGYETWNLFGVSYGTKLGLEVMRQHPEHVRSVVLDSVYPPQVNSVLENPSTFLDSYDKVIEACAAEPACAEGGDLGERIRALAIRYEADPVRIEIRDWIADETDEVYVTGETIVGIVTDALYSPSWFTDLPELVTELENGQTDAVVSFLGQGRTTERFFSSGMFYAIACQEEISFADEAEVAAAIPDDPFGLEDGYDYASNTGSTAFETCGAFANGEAPASSNTAVSSDIPTLLMAGEFDPVTPVSWAERAAETLPNSFLVVGPNDSHGVSSSECGISIIGRFLDAPSQDPDDGCLLDIELNFLAGPDAGVELEPATYELAGPGLKISTVRPEGWTVGTLAGDQYRQQSFLDPTQFFQLAGDDFLAAGLVEFLNTTWMVDMSEAKSFVAGQSVGPIQADELEGNWRRRSGINGNVVVEWFERGSGEEITFVLLVSTAAELDSNLELIVAPALNTIEVSPL